MNPVLNYNFNLELTIIHFRLFLFVEYLTKFVAKASHLLNK